MKASPEAQLRLLELAEIDAELGRLEHRSRGLPEHQELDELQQRDAELRDSAATLDAQERDLKREQAKAEGDVDQVRSRIVRDRERLETGQVSSPRELENLQSEIESLLRRQSDLEEINPGRDGAQGDRRRAATRPPSPTRAQIATQAQALIARRDAALAEIGEQAAKATDRRTAVAAQEPPALLDLYEKLRVQHAEGAALLRRGRCEGCHLSLNTVDLNSIRAADPDEVLRCEECRRILVRSAESGL